MTDPAVSPFDLIREMLEQAAAENLRHRRLRLAGESAALLDQLQRDHEALLRDAEKLWAKLERCRESDRRNHEERERYREEALAAVREAETLREALRNAQHWHEQLDYDEALNVIDAALASSRDTTETTT